MGGIATYIYTKGSFFGRVNTAVARVHAKEDNTNFTFARTQTDDIVFTAGYVKEINDCLSWAGSVHFGFPTHEDTSLQFLQFGTGHFALGGQTDVVYTIDEKNSLLAAMRFLHFFSREVDICNQLICRSFDFTVGNVADLIFIYKHQWQRHKIEVGYNPTFIFDADIKPLLPNVLPQINTVTHNFFGSYRYGFLIKEEYLSAIIMGVSCGITPLPERFGNTTIATAWFSWGINF